MRHSNNRQIINEAPRLFGLDHRPSWQGIASKDLTTIEGRLLAIPQLLFRQGEALSVEDEGSVWERAPISTILFQTSLFTLEEAFDRLTTITVLLHFFTFNIDQVCRQI